MTDKDGNPFNSALEFYECAEPFGLGNPIKLKDRIGKLRRKQGRPKKSKNHYNCNDFEKQGNTKDYILDRLERNHLDVFLDYQAGKYKSARQAGIAAGFVPDIKRMQVAIDPEKVASKIKELFTDEEIAKIISLLLQITNILIIYIL